MLGASVSVKGRGSSSGWPRRPLDDREDHVKDGREEHVEDGG